MLDFTWVVAGPLTTRLLADHGATVVRIESEKRLDAVRAGGPFLAGLTGVEDSAGWHNYAAGKHSLQLDSPTPQPQPVVVDLVRWADLVIESFTPGVIPALGFGYDVLRAINPAVVMCSTSLMGQTGPLAQFSGFGNLAAALTGFYEITGWPDRRPAGPFLAYTDYVAPRFAALAALAAVDHARRTGEGQYVDIAQGEAALHLLAPALLDWTINGRVVTRRGNDDATCVPHGVYPGAGTDRWVAIACQDDAQWRRLAAVIGRDDLADLTATDRRTRRGRARRCHRQMDPSAPARRRPGPPTASGRRRPRRAELDAMRHRPATRPPATLPSSPSPPSRRHVRRRAQRRLLAHRAVPGVGRPDRRPTQRRRPARHPRLRRRHHRRTHHRRCHHIDESAHPSRWAVETSLPRHDRPPVATLDLTDLAERARHRPRSKPSSRTAGR